jgi:peptidoglycan hydrolase-like protein with peptidoglycan-binding domain
MKKFIRIGIDLGKRYVQVHCLESEGGGSISRKLIGKVDGVMGQQSRSAVKAMQIKYGLPADSWPTAELLARMREPRAPPPTQGAVSVR